MKSFVFVLLFLSLMAGACGKKAPDDKVASDVGQAMCAKLKECGPGGTFDMPNCEKGLKDSYVKALGFMGKSGKVKESELTGCVAGIQGMKCDSAAEFTPPPACTFLKR